MKKLEVKFCFGLLILLFQCLPPGSSRPNISLKSDPPRELVPKSATGTHRAVYDLPGCAVGQQEFSQQEFKLVQSDETDDSRETFVCKLTREGSGLVEYRQGWESKISCEVLEQCRLSIDFLNIAESDSKEYGLRLPNEENPVRIYFLINQTENELTELPQSLSKTTPTYESGRNTSKDSENTSKENVKDSAMNGNGTVLIVLGVLCLGVLVFIAIAVSVLYYRFIVFCRHNKTGSSITAKRTNATKKSRRKNQNRYRQCRIKPRTSAMPTGTRNGRSRTIIKYKVEDVMAAILGIKNMLIQAMEKLSEVSEKQKEVEKVQMAEKWKLTETLTNPEDRGSSTSTLTASNAAEAVTLKTDKSSIDFVRSSLSGLAINSKMNQPNYYVPESLSRPEVSLPSKNKFPGDLQPPLQGNDMPVEVPVAQNSKLVSPGKSYEDHGPASETNIENSACSLTKDYSRITRKKFDTAHYGGGSPGEHGILLQHGAAEEIKKDEKDQA